MKLENTLENKAKFFSLYLLQNVVKWHNRVCDKKAFLHWSLLDIKVIGAKYLELTPLSQITDENLVKLYHIHSGCICYDYTMDFKDVLTMAKHWRSMEDEMWQSNVVKYTKCAFYLISKGYYVGDGTEIEYGWAKLRESK